MILLAPLIAAIVAVAVSRSHRAAKYIALGASLVSLALFPLVSGGTESIGWLTVGGVGLNVTTSVAPINSLLLLAVLLIGPVVLLYSFGFMEFPSEQRRFYLEMLAFETAMLAFAMSGSFVLLFIGWEFLSVTSYLLIGFWNGRDGANRAARKAITMVLVGDLALVGAMAILIVAFGTLEFSGILGAVQGGAALPLSAVALLMVAIFTKSAQFPFHEWLPDAMEGPTPVSAFLHSSTMVKAGVFVAILLFPLFSASGTLPILLYVGLATVVLSTLNAMRERQIKRVLAYSTVQELGLMLAAVGSGSLLAAAYFLFAQSFYKALLFLTAGASMKANGKENLDEVGGLKQNRIVYVTALFGVLSLAGFVPFGGFFANLGLASSLGTNFAVYAFVSVISLATSFYILRWFTLQTKKTGRASTALNYRTVPRSMACGLVLLAGATLISGAAFFLIPGFVGNGAAGLLSGTTLQVNIYGAAIETAIVATGSFMGYSVYRQKKKAATKLTLGNLADRAYTARIMNAVYANVAAFVLVLGDGINYFDTAVIGLFDVLGRGAMGLGNSAKRAATGEINTYVVILAVGMLLLILALAIV